MSEDPGEELTNGARYGPPHRHGSVPGRVPRLSFPGHHKAVLHRRGTEESDVTGRAAKAQAVGSRATSLLPLLRQAMRDTSQLL